VRKKEQGERCERKDRGCSYESEAAAEVPRGAKKSGCRVQPRQRSRRILRKKRRPIAPPTAHHEHHDRFESPDATTAT